MNHLPIFSFFVHSHGTFCAPEGYPKWLVVCSLKEAFKGLVQLSKRRNLCGGDSCSYSLVCFEGAKQQCLYIQCLKNFGYQPLKNTHTHTPTHTILSYQM